MESDPAGVQEFASLPDHPGAWNGRQYSDESNYIYQLSSLELQELSDALLKFKGTVHHYCWNYIYIYYPFCLRLRSTGFGWRSCLPGKLPTSYSTSQTS